MRQLLMFTDRHTEPEDITDKAKDGFTWDFFASIGCDYFDALEIFEKAPVTSILDGHAMYGITADDYDTDAKKMTIIKNVLFNWDWTGKQWRDSYPYIRYATDEEMGWKPLVHEDQIFTAIDAKAEWIDDE